jgi:hypothetical protein
MFRDPEIQPLAVHPSREWTDLAFQVASGTLNHGGAARPLLAPEVFTSSAKPEEGAIALFCVLSLFKRSTPRSSPPPTSVFLRLRFLSVGEGRVPLPSSFGGQIHQIPQWREQVDSAFLDLRRHPRMCGIKVPHKAVTVSRKNRDGGILPSVNIFTAKIEFEGT